MSHFKSQIGEIAYNPAFGVFEALVTFHTEAGPQRVAATFNAPLTAEFDHVSRGLLQDALRQRHRPDALKSRFSTAPRPAIGPDADMPRHAA